MDLPLPHLSPLSATRYYGDRATCEGRLAVDADLREGALRARAGAQVGDRAHRRCVLVPPRVASGEGGIQKLTRRHDTDAIPAVRGKVLEIAGDEECSVGGDRHFQEGPIAGVG